MTSETPQPAIVLHDLTVGYGGHPAVHHLSGSFVRGSLTAVYGPNGAGKSTLLKVVAGLLRPLGGRVDLRGLEPGGLGFLPQQAEVDRSFPITVADMVALGLWRSVGALGRVTADHWVRVGQALAIVGLTGFESRAIGSLSAGQFQRVLFARLLLQDAPVILLDEPFTAMDARTTADLLAVVLRWHGQGRTVLAVIHDLEQARQHFPSTLLLAREPIAWGPTAQTLTEANLYRSRQLAEAWDEDALACPRPDRPDEADGPAGGRA